MHDVCTKPLIFYDSAIVQILFDKTRQPNRLLPLYGVAYGLHDSHGALVLEPGQANQVYDDSPSDVARSP